MKGWTYDETLRYCPEIAHQHPDAPNQPKAPAEKLRIPTVNGKGQNKTEARFDAFLYSLLVNAEIDQYGFERMKFRLAKRTWYTPDFDLILPNGQLVFVETKGGYIREDGYLKLKIAAEQSPFPFFLAVYDKRRWDIMSMPSRCNRVSGVNLFVGINR